MNSVSKESQIIQNQGQPSYDAINTNFCTRPSIHFIDSFSLVIYSLRFYISFPSKNKTVFTTAILQYHILLPPYSISPINHYYSTHFINKSLWELQQFFFSLVKYFKYFKKSKDLDITFIQLVQPQRTPKLDL